MIYGEFRLNTYIHLLEKYYTTTSSERKRRVRGVHLLTLVVASLFMFMSIIPLSEAANMLWFLGIVLVIEMVMVTMIVSYVMKIEYSAEDLYALMEERDNNNNNINNNINNNGNNNSVEAIGSNTVYSPVVGDDLANARKVAEPNISAPLIVRIDAAMEKDNLFLNPDLSLVSFSEQVGSNRTYVSKAIKDAKGCSFSDYVNRYRLDYALELMKNTSKENMVIQNIATQCGCGSVQTFYRYFKLFFNETPTQWIERNK
jgi:YesN/AraC family two-component response regulator